jgi:hypothetical protein
MQPDLFQTPVEQRRTREREGKLRKKVGLDSVSYRNQFFLNEVRHWAISRSNWNGSVSIEDVRDWADSMGLVPSHPNAWGVVFKGKHWKPCGECKNTIPSTHHRRILLWKWQP